jgi:hypothetical protein
MPSRGQLPDDLAPLADRQNIEMPDAYFVFAAERLVQALEEIVSPPRAGRSTKKTATFETKPVSTRVPSVLDQRSIRGRFGGAIAALAGLAVLGVAGAKFVIDSSPPSVVDVAGLKIRIDGSPPVPEPVRPVLRLLDHELIEYILTNYGGANRVDTCYHAPNPDELEAASVKSRLKALGLINFEEEEWSENGKPCEAGSKTTYTPLYDEVRRYLLDSLSRTKLPATDR